MKIPDFLAEHQPTALTANALWYLQQFFQGNTWENGLSFERLLREHYPDYSLKSLNRLDKLLDHIRETQHPTADAFLDEEANREFIYLLAFYAGEVLGRAKRQAVIWVDERATEEGVSVEFSRLFFCHYREAGECVEFLPLSLLYGRLFAEHPQSFSLYRAVAARVDTAVEPTQKLPEPPPQSLDFSGQQMLKQTPAAHLAYLQLLPPSWLAKDPLRQQILDLPTLYEKGRVVWGALVQANTALFDHDYLASCPADIIYDPTGRTDPQTLHEIASNLFKLKDANADTDNRVLDNYAKYLANERTRVYAHLSAIEHLHIRCATVFIWRLHLPDARLAEPVFPLLIADEAKTVTLLPARYWAHTAFYQAWLDGDKAHEIAPAFARLLDKKPRFWLWNQLEMQLKHGKLPSLGATPVDFLEEDDRARDDTTQRLLIRQIRQTCEEDSSALLPILLWVGVVMLLLGILVCAIVFK